MLVGLHSGTAGAQRHSCFCSLSSDQTGGAVLAATYMKALHSCSLLCFALTEQLMLLAAPATRAGACASF